MDRNKLTFYGILFLLVGCVVYAQNAGTYSGGGGGSGSGTATLCNGLASATAATCPGIPAPTSYGTSGAGYISGTFVAGATSTGAPLTLNIAGLGAKNVYLNGAATSATNVVTSGVSYPFYYDGTQIQLQAPTSGATIGAIVTAASATTLHTPSASATVDSSGNLTANSVNAGNSSSSGKSTFSGSTSGSASIGVSATAGTPSEILLPTSDCTSGPCLIEAATASGGIQQLSSVQTTGTGNAVLAISPTLVTPALGTPSAINLANASGSPSLTQVTVTLPDSITVANCKAATTVSTPCVAYNGTITSQGNAGGTGTVTLYTSSAPANGMFQMCSFLNVDVPGTGGNLETIANWTTPGGAVITNYNFGSVALNNYGANVNCYTIATGLNTTFNVAQSAVSGTGGSTSWEGSLTVMRLH